MHLFMDGHLGHYMLFIYRTLIIVIRYSFTYNIISYEKSVGCVLYSLHVCVCGCVRYDDYV